MSKIMLKMLADMAGITPEQIADNVEAFQRMATEGIETLEQINARLAAIEQHLGISQIVENDATFQDGLRKALSDGHENRIADAA